MKIIWYKAQSFPSYWQIHVQCVSYLLRHYIQHKYFRYSFLTNLVSSVLKTQNSFGVTHTFYNCIKTCECNLLLARRLLREFGNWERQSYWNAIVWKLFKSPRSAFYFDSYLHICCSCVCILKGKLSVLQFSCLKSGIYTDLKSLHGTQLPHNAFSTVLTVKAVIIKECQKTSRKP